MYALCSMTIGQNNYKYIFRWQSKSISAHFFIINSEYINIFLVPLTSTRWYSSEYKYSTPNIHQVVYSSEYKYSTSNVHQVVFF